MTRTSRRLAAEPVGELLERDARRRSRRPDAGPRVAARSRRAAPAMICGLTASTRTSRGRATSAVRRRPPARRCACSKPRPGRRHRVGCARAALDVEQPGARHPAARRGGHLPRQAEEPDRERGTGVVSNRLGSPIRKTCLSSCDAPRRYPRGNAGNGHGLPVAWETSSPRAESVNPNHVLARRHAYV